MTTPPKKISCDIADITSSLEQLQLPTVQLSVNATSLLSTAYQLYPIWEQLAETCLHLHAMHYHTISNNPIHYVGDRQTESRSCITSTSTENVDALAIEQNSFTDVNQTGMIFGRDYSFGYETDLPRFYKSMLDADVNEFTEEQKADIRQWQTFLDAAMNDLYMASGEKCGSEYDSVAPPSLLIMEFFKEEDLDDNGLLYGEHFIIESPDAPDELIQLNISNGIKESNPDILVKTWTEYLNELKPEGPIMELFKFSPFTKQELVDELIGEFLSCQDINGDGLVYGRDFLIVGDDKPMQLTQYVPLYLPNIITTWLSYVKSREYNQPDPKSKYEQLLKDEYDQNHDLDGNGLIYGVDFIISTNGYFTDEDLLALSDLDILSDMTLSEYHNGIKPYVENYVLDENIQAAKYNAEWLDKKDADDNGLVYGRDFILSDYEGNKTECLWTIERYRNYHLEWTPEKIEALGLGHMLSNYSQTEFDQYWRCSEDDKVIGPSVPEDTDTDGGTIDDETTLINYECNAENQPIIPLELNSTDLSNHIVLYNGKYWFDLGTGDTIHHEDTYLVPDNEEISLLDLTIQRIFDQFNDASIYFIKTTKEATSENPYVFKITIDDRRRVYPSERRFSIVDSCLEFNEATIAEIESLTETRNYIITSDTRVDKSIPFDQNVDSYAIRWLYNDETESGKWVLWGDYTRIIDRVIISDSTSQCCQICVPMYKESDEFKHFLPYVLNVTWNDT